jgi:hypothetical protein
MGGEQSLTLSPDEAAALRDTVLEEWRSALSQ